jgi:hypothetical protein
LSHSHIPVQHLLKQVEVYRAKRSNRDSRPDWITNLIGQVAELFEPISDLGRVGFDCKFDEDRWTVGMFLGSTEMVGGRDDGRSMPADYNFDLQRLIGLFGHIDLLVWSAWPNGGVDSASRGSSFLTVEGVIEDNPVRLQIHSNPPSDAGPGFRQFSDGRQEPV